jgi:hypothetical protein
MPQARRAPAHRQWDFGMRASLGQNTRGAGYSLVSRDRRDARKSADRLHPDAAQKSGSKASPPRELAVGIHQNVLSLVAAARLRVPMQGAPEVIPGAHLGQDLARQGELLAGIDS